MSNNTSRGNASGGISFMGLLTIVFITLKLTHFIDWSWWLVLLPLYGGAAVLLVILIIGLIFLYLTGGNKKKW